MPGFNTAAAVIAALCLSSAALAADATRTPVTARITTADLDLATPAGQAKLRSRIRLLAASQCAAQTPDLDALRDSSRCRSEMIRDGDVRIAALASRTRVAIADTSDAMPAALAK